MNMRIHSFLPCSKANGPGTRACIWFQGCTLGCKGCCNPGARDPGGGEIISVVDMSEKITSLDNIEGISISGGEPFQQPLALYELLKLIRAKKELSVLVFTGYSIDEIREDPLKERILPMVDILVAGRYDQDKATPGGLLASANQKIHFLSDRYGPGDMENLADLEIYIEENGNITATGISSPAIFLQDGKETF
ncbi:MAG: radical SAM protein [Candidatus Eremiobacteraeota bacterium]|nr:radical SAM protein [Candidatus Eremiobacteraeota bacterium]